ncbi:hypothetical protein KA111_01020 [Candidatus Woesebacteria bacterium]|nr:hypothetical protein [Candidatus Woesebacteria bacterium]
MQMQNEQTSGFQSFVNSPEFKKRSTNIADGTIKFIANWIALALKAILDALKMMIRMALGK